MVRLFFVLCFLMCAFGALAQPADLVTTHGREFVHNGQTFRFIGVNMRGLSHYGHGQPLIYTTTQHADENLDAVQAMGGKVIRLFAANKHHSTADNIAHLSTTLDKMQARGLKAIVVLTDVYTTDFHPAGDDIYYQAQPGGYTLLDDTWFASGYTVNYLPWVQSVVGALKDHSAIFAWEIGNELTDIKNPNNIIAFTQNVAGAIKAIDSHHMVTTGFIGIDHTQIGISNGVALYNNPNIDFMTVHTYSGDDPLQNWAVNARVEKPIVLEEFGYAASVGNRVTNTQAQVNKWFDQRLVNGFMQWGFQVQTYDIGDGDGIFGMDRNFFASEWDALHSIYSTRAASLAAAAVPIKPLPNPEGTNLARNAIAWEASSSYDGNNTGNKAYDGVLSPSSKWTSSGAAPPHWLALDLGDEKNVTGFRIRMANDAGENVQYAFESFQIQQGSKLEGAWTNLHTISNPAQYARVTIEEDVPVKGRYFRILITEPGVDNYARLPEFEIIGTSPMHGWQIRN